MSLSPSVTGLPVLAFSTNVPCFSARVKVHGLGGPSPASFCFMALKKPQLVSSGVLGGFGFFPKSPSRFLA